MGSVRSEYIWNYNLLLLGQDIYIYISNKHVWLLNQDIVLLKIWMETQKGHCTVFLAGSEWSVWHNVSFLGLLDTIRMQNREINI